MFTFKEFTVHQERCAMKIGTDGVLLGAWAPVTDAVDSILDIGAGTGILALMMAQRAAADTIDAMEIDTEAFEQAVENFENSPWGDRLFCYHASFQEFADEIEEEYDLIISNPPFFEPTYKTSDPQRDTARFEDALPLEHLFAGVQRLLSSKGNFAVVVPYTAEERAVTIASQFELYPQKLTRVKGMANTPIKRTLFVFGREAITPALDELVIEHTRHEYTEDYINLTKDFYIKM